MTKGHVGYSYLRVSHSHCLDLPELKVLDQEKLLDLYLSDNFPKEMLQEKKASLENATFEQKRQLIELSDVRGTQHSKTFRR